METIKERIHNTLEEELSKYPANERDGIRSAMDRLHLESAVVGACEEQQEIDIQRAVEWLKDKCFDDSLYSFDIDDFEHSMKYEQAMKGDILSQKIDDKSLSIRCLRCLESADIVTFGDLVKYKRLDLLKFRNFGHKSLHELDDLLSRNGLEWKGE